MQKNKLPYFDDRTVKIDTLVIHCLAHNVKGALESFHHHEVSAHYLIEENGQMWQLVPEEKRAWHAGKSYWRGREGLNNFSIGIELCSETLGQEPYDTRQIRALVHLCRQIIKRYHIRPENIVGHSDIAPTRKPDPGKAFPWAYLAHHGIGQWFKLENAINVSENDIPVLLSNIGYDVSNLAAAEMAFCRHYLPERIKTDKNIRHLLENPFDPDFLPKDQAFIQALQAVVAEQK